MNYWAVLKQDLFSTFLVANYNLNSNSNDAVNGYNGTDTSVSYSNSGINGNCATFNGTSSFIELADQDDFSFTDGVSDVPFTINFWCYFPSSIGSNTYMFSAKRYETTYNEWQIGLSGGNLLLILFSANTNTSNISTSIANPIATSTWTMLTFSYDGSESNTGLKIYANGVLLATTPNSVGTYLGMDNTASKVTIGKRINTGSPGFVNGRIDAFSIWKKRELNKLEIKQLYNSGAGKFYPFN